MSAYPETLVAKPHTAVYRMHKYFARRPWNVFSHLITQYSTQGEVILDPFCGGGVTVVEALKLRRRVVGVDSNPLATYITSMECAPADLPSLGTVFDELSTRVASRLSSLYRTRCNKCRSNAIADWLEWDEKSKRISRLKLDCPRCGKTEQKANRADQLLAEKIKRNFENLVDRPNLWFPTTRIPRGDKTDSLLHQNLVAFHELFTTRNLLALAILRKEILEIENTNARELLMFALSSSLKWASRQSHLRGEIVEGWAMHAYWVYPKSLELNEWNVYKRRYRAVYAGKQYSNEHIGPYCKFADNFNQLGEGEATCLLLNKNAAELPIPDNSVDSVITDPPYGGNVNYAELSDFWHIWISRGKVIDKKDEAVINKTQKKSIDEYRTLLELVFKECYRVLKEDRFLVSTFNSKDFRIVASFILAASRAGFILTPTGVKYQAPIRPYATTFHAMQIGAFVGDFIFAFKKGGARSSLVFKESELRRIESDISQLVQENIQSNRPEPDLRERAYSLLIPFLANYAVTNPSECAYAAEFFERKIIENDGYFKGTREKLTDERRRTFGSRNREWAPR
jgi:16S rRNA G966 N2-methylase RsmD